jgi:hypothetical protein
MQILQPVAPPPRALEARLYLDRALSDVRADGLEAEDVAVAFADVLYGNPRLLTMTIARGPSARPVVVTDASGNVDARASDALHHQLMAALYGVVAFA